MDAVPEAASHREAPFIFSRNARTIDDLDDHFVDTMANQFLEEMTAFLPGNSRIDERDLRWDRTGEGTRR